MERMRKDQSKTQMPDRGPNNSDWAGTGGVIPNSSYAVTQEVLRQQRAEAASGGLTVAQQDPREALLKYAKAGSARHGGAVMDVFERAVANNAQPRILAQMTIEQEEAEKVKRRKEILKQANQGY